MKLTFHWAGHTFTSECPWYVLVISVLGCCTALQLRYPASTPDLWLVAVMSFFWCVAYMLLDVVFQLWDALKEERKKDETSDR